MLDLNLPVLPEEAKEQEIEPSLIAPEFALDIDDDELMDVIEKRITEATKYYKETLKLDSRSQENENFWIGKQLDESKLYEFQVPYKDNLIYQDLETRISLAASRMPDIIVTPSNKDDQSRQLAKNLEEALDIKIKSEATRRMVKDGLRNLHIYLRAALKVRWDKNKGENGDFIFELARPQRLILDHTATIPHDGFTADNMEMVVEIIEEPVAVVVAKFPNKKADLFHELGIIKGTTKQMVSKIKYHEIWFTWYDNEGKALEGVCWKYKRLLLGKAKNPYFDQGNALPFEQPIYRNHFERPRKPYIFFSHQNLGKSPIDDTSPLEQAIPLQKIVNKRGRQITEIADRAIPKIAFAGRFITREQVRRITNDPDEHIWIENAENISAALTPVSAQPPSPVLYNDMVGNRLQIDSKFATHATTRGELVPQESGVSKQITREGDLSISDDLVAIVVERVTYEMANWAVQMMKVLYDKPHFVRDLGKDGELLSVEMSQDSIEDGILVNVKSSSTDKAQRRSDAINLAARRSIDPLSLAEDLDLPNPKERTKRLIAFLSQDMNFYAKVANLEMAPPSGQGGQGGQAQQQAVLDIQRMQAGEEFEPTSTDPAYISTIQQFASSPDFQALPPETQGIFTRYLDRLVAPPVV